MVIALADRTRKAVGVPLGDAVARAFPVRAERAVPGVGVAAQRQDEPGVGIRAVDVAVEDIPGEVIEALEAVDFRKARALVTPVQGVEE